MLHIHMVPNDVTEAFYIIFDGSVWARPLVTNKLRVDTFSLLAFPALADILNPRLPPYVSLCISGYF